MSNRLHRLDNPLSQRRRRHQQQQQQQKQQQLGLVYATVLLLFFDWRFNTVLVQSLIPPSTYHAILRRCGSTGSSRHLHGTSPLNEENESIKRDDSLADRNGNQNAINEYVINGDLLNGAINGEDRANFWNGNTGSSSPSPTTPNQLDKQPQREVLDTYRMSNFNVNGYTMPAGNSRYRDMLEAKGTVISKLFGPKPIKVSTSSSSKNDRTEEENEDGWADMRKDKKRSFMKTTLRLPIDVIKERLFQRTVEPGTLILVRHGESVWNANKTFTGWADPDLSERGRREVEHAARLLLEGGYRIDVCFTSRLTRAIRSTWLMLMEMNEVYLPVFKSWRLNERMYGALTGLSKIELAEQLGKEQVQEWRSSLFARPPALSPSDAYWPGRERKYADLSFDQIPLTESLMDCMERTVPVWEDKILYELRRGRNVMVVAHANTLRGLVKIIDNISHTAIEEVAIPTGIPIIYKFDQDMKTIPPSGDRQSASQLHMNGLFLEKPGLLKEALTREEEWKRMFPDYNPHMGQNKSPMPALERQLYKLRAEREMGRWAGQFIDPNAEFEDDGTDGNMGLPMKLITREDVSRETVVNVDGGPSAGPAIVANLITNHPCVTSMPSAALLPGIGAVPVRRDAVIVIIRHGKTEHNILGLFTGWEDAPLAKEGVEEAKEAGRLLKQHGFEFDVVYTSWLSRAIETAWHVIDELDSLWLPIVKSWRLNERMYGSLTGLSKQMVKQRHGETQFKAWRRGFKTPPPKVSSFSQHYPGNDRRYQLLNDVRFSFRESIIRSIEQGRPQLHRKLPKTESLKDCMDRTIPFFTQCIVPEAIDQGKRVLISSSENAIRGLLMHLCEIPEEKITELEIPNGLPIIFDIKSQCVKLLDDGTGRDPLEVHNFGKAASYLFRPCTNEDGSPDEECIITYSGSEPIMLTAEQMATIEAIKGQRVPIVK